MLIILGMLILAISFTFLLFGYRYHKWLLILSSALIGASIGSFGTNNYYLNIAICILFAVSFGLMAYLFEYFALAVPIAAVGYYIVLVLGDNLLSYSIDWDQYVAPAIAAVGAAVAITCIIQQFSKSIIIAFTAFTGAIGVSILPVLVIFSIDSSRFDNSLTNNDFTYLGIPAVIVTAITAMGILFQVKKSSRNVIDKPRNTNNPLYRYRLFIAMTIAIGLLTIYIFLPSYKNNLLNKLQFQIYEPSKLPDNATIVKRYAQSQVPTDASVENPVYYITISSGELKISQTKNINYRGETKAHTPSCPVSLDPNWQYDCKLFTSPLNTVYLVNTERYASSKIRYINILFVKNDTAINTSVGNDYIAKYENFNWNEYIDSFKPVNAPVGLEIVRKRAP